MFAYCYYNRNVIFISNTSVKFWKNFLYFVNVTHSFGTSSCKCAESLSVYLIKRVNIKI